MPEYKVGDFQYSGGTKHMPTATIGIIMPDGSERVDAAEGNGPVDALVKAIERILMIKIEVIGFSIDALDLGSSAKGEVVARIRCNGFEHRGVGDGTDIIVASARAMVNALSNPSVPSEPSISAYEHVVGR